MVISPTATIEGAIKSMMCSGGENPQTKTTANAKIAGFGDLRRPENVSVDSLNTRYVLRWDWPHETTANQTVTFTAQYIAEFRSRKAKHDKLWRSVCVNNSEHRCDFTRAELHYQGLYLLRVRANTSQQSSSWVQIGFCPDKQGDPAVCLSVVCLSVVCLCLSVCPSVCQLSVCQ
ncbi:hypothetical protein QQF64_006720 [Cirrhinus molitorella]|uniref:Fibronectin type-III domain-containing protein n=1 Tax=Cirrhinus molitorella TaxID=172907 RepID=A0ABR3M8N6_9TELE